MIHVSVVNHSSDFPDTDLPVLANALQLQETRDYAPLWGGAARIYFTPKGKQPSADHWALGLFDNADQANALGWHDVTPAGLPLGKVFVRTTTADGSLVSVTASHEYLEMRGDPRVNKAAQVGSKWYAYENADPVEADADGYDVTIPTGWTGAGTVVRVSNFILESWWQPGSDGPFDFMKQLTAPLELRPGGYIGFLDMNNLRAGWQQEVARSDVSAKMRARPRSGSRRMLRSVDLADRVRSVYSPGTEAVPAQEM